MNQLNANILDNDELAHYAAIGAVNILDESVIVRLTESLTDLQEDFEEASDERDTAQSTCGDLEEDVDTAENHAGNIEADLRALSDELQILFVKYPNLKNSVPDLHEVYERTKRDGI